MALTENQMACIELLVEGKLTKTDIAEKIGVSRKAIYYWLGLSEFKAELDKRVEVNISEGDKQIKLAFPRVVEELVNLALNPKTEVRTKNNACQYIINRVLGSPTNSTNLEVTDGDAAEKTDAIKEFEALFASKIQAEASKQINNTGIHSKNKAISSVGVGA